MKHWLFLAALPMLAADTQRFTVSAPGTIRIDRSYGEVDIDGWDRPEVEVTVVKSSEKLHDSKGRVDSVQVTSKQTGNDVVISTVYPPRNGFLHPLDRRSDVEINYRIHAPRASKLAIEQQRGGLSVYDISGDIHARVINGQISLTLAADHEYKIDAQATIGDVYSDFDGRTQRRQLLGQEYNHAGSTPAANLYLRVRLGDIVIQKSDFQHVVLPRHDGVENRGQENR